MNVIKEFGPCPLGHGEKEGLPGAFGAELPEA